MLGRIVKVERKVRKCVVKVEKKEPYLGACDCLEKGKTVSFSGEKEPYLGACDCLEKRKTVSFSGEKEPYLGACDCLEKGKTVSFSGVCGMQS